MKISLIIEHLQGHLRAITDLGEHFNIELKKHIESTIWCIMKGIYSTIEAHIKHLNRLI